MQSVSFNTSFSISAMILLIVVGAKPFTSVFIALNGDTLIQEFIIGMGMSRLGVLIIFLLLTFIIGMLLDWTAIVLILLPIFLPLTDKVGYNRLYVVALMAVMMQTAFLTPPVGGSLFFIKGVTPDTPWPVIYKGVFPFVIIMLFVVSLLVISPQIIIGQ